MKKLFTAIIISYVVMIVTFIGASMNMFWNDDYSFMSIITVVGSGLTIICNIGYIRGLLKLDISD